MQIIIELKSCCQHYEVLAKRTDVSTLPEAQGFQSGLGQEKHIRIAEYLNISFLAVCGVYFLSPYQTKLVNQELSIWEHRVN